MAIFALLPIGFDNCKVTQIRAIGKIKLLMYCPLTSF